jgi:hypothetical protein
MLDWFNPLFDSHAELTGDAVVARMLSACLFGIVVALIYFNSIGRRKSDSLPFGVTLILLSILVAMTTLIIGNNQALAFSLVGTLAIVRFRTTMDDTRDTAFVIFAVAVGMGSAVGALKVVLVGIPIVALVVTVTTWIGSRVPVSGPERLLLIRMASAAADPACLSPIFARHTLRHQLMGFENVKNGEIVEYQYAVKFASPDWLPAVTDCKAVAGVTSVEVKGK